jgi:hypothetical protein
MSHCYASKRLKRKVLRLLILETTFKDQTCERKNVRVTKCSTWNVQNFVGNHVWLNIRSCKSNQVNTLV